MVLADIIAWMKGMEVLARDVYRKAARKSDGSPALQKILQQMAQDEARHAELLTEVLDTIDPIREVRVDEVAVDEETRFHIEKDLRVLNGKLDSDGLNQRDLIQAVVDLEFSEWNPVFCYVVACYQSHSRSLQKAASEIQAHEERLERFLAVLPEHLQPDRSGRQLPKVWERNILVVDDEKPLLVLYQQLLARFGRVVTAENGLEALEKIRASAFDAILTDMDMPLMGGLEFFRRAIEFDPDLAGRFIIYTGTVSEQEEALAREFPVAILAKPVSIRMIQETVEQVLLRRHQ